MLRSTFAWVTGFHFTAGRHWIFRFTYCTDTYLLFHSLSSSLFRNRYILLEKVYRTGYNILEATLIPQKVEKSPDLMKASEKCRQQQTWLALLSQMALSPGGIFPPFSHGITGSTHLPNPQYPYLAYSTTNCSDIPSPSPRQCGYSPAAPHQSFCQKPFIHRTLQLSLYTPG